LAIFLIYYAYVVLSRQKLQFTSEPQHNLYYNHSVCNPRTSVRFLLVLYIDLGQT